MVLHPLVAAPLSAWHLLSRQRLRALLEGHPGLDAEVVGEVSEEILQEFLVEAREHLTHFELALLELESDPTQQAPLQALFRSVHTIKGSCGYFEFTKTEAVTHAAENLLDRVRDGRKALISEITDAVLAMVDVVRGLLNQVERTRSEGDADVSPIVQRVAAAVVRGRRGRKWPTWTR